MWTHFLKRATRLVMNKYPVDTATLRNGITLKIGDEVTTNIYPKCVGQVFVIEEMNEYAACDSGVIILAHLKDDPERKLRGFQKEGYVQLKPEGLDANWFEKVPNFGTEVDSPTINSTVMATKSKSPAKKTAKKAAPKKGASKSSSFEKQKKQLMKDHKFLTEEDFTRYDGEQDESIFARVTEKVKATAQA